MVDTYSAKQVAKRIGTDAKTLRKFLRSPSSPYQAVGQGQRYEFPQTELGDIKKAFLHWQAKNERRKEQARLAATTPMPKPKVRENPQELLVAEDEDEPTEEDLAAIEAEGLEIEA